MSANKSRTSMRSNFRFGSLIVRLQLVTFSLIILLNCLHLSSPRGQVHASLISSGIVNNILTSGGPSSNSDSFLSKLFVAPSSVLSSSKSPAQNAPTPASDPCYDSFGKPRRCITDFVNAAFGKEVQASSTCGTPPTRYCQTTYDSESQPIRNCFVCDDNHPKRSHPVQYLTDLNNPNNVTCWQSEPFIEEKNVTLTLSLGKRYELTYVSLQFCSTRPDSMSVYKSSDYGRTWTPFQYYSSNCKAVYGKSSRVAISKANEQEALCTDAHLMSNNLGFSGLRNSGGSGRVAFSTLEGRPSAFDIDNSVVLQDWVTATDIRIVFNRVRAAEGDDKFPHDGSSGILSNSLLDSQQQDLYATLNVASSSSQSNNNNNNESIMSYSGSPPPSTSLHLASKLRESQYYALSDFAVGGRCKCNGHASKCLFDRTGKLVCDCKHGTAGNDCEKCKPFHYDHPWGRATAREPHECTVCNCNQHSRRCQFSMELYKLSGRKSGGVCMNCRHNTAGRHCHYCKEGFYRDSTKPVTHRKACLECDCHPVGASGKTCNQTSGQCACKEGVIGLTCNQCAKGYQQSRSPIAPCIRTPKSAQELNGIESTENENGKCSTCEVMSRRVNQRKYCKKDYVIQAQLLSRDTQGEWLRFTINVVSIYKRGHGKIVKGDQYMYLHQTDYTCKCPKLRLGQQYLIMGRYHSGGDENVRAIDDHKSAMIINADSTVIEWKDEWARRLRKFHKRERKGRCKRPALEGTTNAEQNGEEEEEE
ncbi:Netrin unc-6 [Hypsibius exemplaris]|uniref:Netrin unc-6 n=1 Tax=Hypsibius exemplaris TaxID=2072580 RepID=A0A1W0WZV7_HYPEX|nr:Netrin unc-6 [Hypsibius exemplaris]